MKWSFSGTKLFKQCPRKWYFQYVLTDSRVKDTLQSEAASLKKLSSLAAWRGKLVDTVISNYAVPRLNRNEDISEESLTSYALSLADEQLANAENPEHSSDNELAVCNLFEIEYGFPVDPERVQKAKDEVVVSLRNFLSSGFVSDFRKDGSLIIAQRTIRQSRDGVSISCTPDIVAFYKSSPPLLVDWKVQVSDHTEHWQQLALYACVISGIRPHRDFPQECSETLRDPTKIRLLEFQLLQQHERLYTLSQSDVIEVEDYIYSSSNKMLQMLRGRKYPLLQPDDIPTTNRASTCVHCQFRRICWDKVAS